MNKQIENKTAPPHLAAAIERMARAGAHGSLPTNGMFNSDQLGAMESERMPTYRRIAEVMLQALLDGARP